MNLYKWILSTQPSLYLIGLFLLFGNGCTKKFAEFNTNPNNATEEMMGYDNLKIAAFYIQMQQNVFPAGSLSSSFGGQYQLSQNLIGDVYSGYMGVSNNWFGGSNNTTYNLITGWNGEAFNRAFLGVLPAWLQIKKNAQQSSPHAYALAQLIKVEAIHRTTDIYGPLPYLRFGQGSLNTPYDSQEAIYRSFFVDLDSAIVTLSDFVQKNPGVKPLAKFDLIYEGDYVKWIKFANSLKLRLAMRMVYANPADAQRYAEAAVSNPYGVLTSNTDNALLKSTNGIVISHPLHLICYDFNDIRMGATMESFLKGYKDPRISTWFNKATAPASDDYYGIRNGIALPEKSKYTPFSTLNLTSSTPVQWMAAAEMYFLRAEGALRGWNMGGSAQTLYETGIQTAFANANAGNASAYIQDSTSQAAPYSDFVNSSNNVEKGSGLSTITIKWKNADPFESQLERIITQKWLAMYPDGQEAWSEFRRTTYPKVFPVVVNNSGGLISTQLQIRRIPFTQGEYQSNGAEVAKGITLLGGPDNGGTRLWWDKKP